MEGVTIKTEGTKKVGVRGQVIHSQGREIIANVISFMEREARGEIILPMENVKQRTLSATGISRSTYYKIKKEKRDVEEGSSSSYITPGRKRFKESKKSKLTEFHAYEIRRLLYYFQIVEKKILTIKLLREKMIESGIDFAGKDTTLRAILRNLGFRWKKTVDNRKVLCERYEIRSLRINFLRELCKYRTENRPIIYIYETYIRNMHTTSKCQSDNPIVQQSPVTKGKPLIIAHAGGENGFIPNTLLIFNSEGKAGDHPEMNHENFTRWLEENVIPNLPERSVIVIDNPKYCNVKAVKYPTSEWKKDDMIQWLRERSIKFPSNGTKPELYDIIKTHIPSNPVYKIDQLLAQHGHDVLKLPPNHQELNPLEKIWALVKKWVAANATFNLINVQRLMQQQFEQICESEWYNVCESVKQIECEYIEKEHIIDEFIDSFIVYVSDNDSDEEFQSSDEDE